MSKLCLVHTELITDTVSCKQTQRLQQRQSLPIVLIPNCLIHTEVNTAHCTAEMVNVCVPVKLLKHFKMRCWIHSCIVIGSHTEKDNKVKHKEFFNVS